MYPGIGFPGFLTQACKIIESAGIHIAGLQDEDCRLIKFGNQPGIDSTLRVGVHPLDIIDTETE